jgi:hypothetical protein
LVSELVEAAKNWNFKKILVQEQAVSIVSGFSYQDVYL